MSAELLIASRAKKSYEVGDNRGKMGRSSVTTGRMATLQEVGLVT